VPQSRLSAFLLLAAASLFWSGNWIAGRALREAFDPVTLNFWRWTIATLVLAPFALPGLRGKWAEVQGPYTYKGHDQVLASLEEGAKLLEREQWVVPLGRDEQADNIPKHLQTLAGDYDTKYIEQWTDWLADLKVQSPSTLKDAIELYTVLTDQPR